MSTAMARASVSWPAPFPDSPHAVIAAAFAATVGVVVARVNNGVLIELTGGGAGLRAASAQNAAPAPTSSRRPTPPAIAHPTPSAAPLPDEGFVIAMGSRGMPAAVACTITLQ